MKKVHLDYAAGAPVDPRVIEVMVSYLKDKWGNPFSVHSSGREAMSNLEESRKKIADLINCKGEEIIFTSGATEANNLALKGIAIRMRKKGKHIITSRIEHPSILEPCEILEEMGFKITYLPVNKYGIVDTEKLERAIREETILISIIYANNEIGTIEPIKDIGEIAREKNIYFHTDAVAATGKIPINVEKDHVDLMTISSNDIYGPKGVGALFIKKGTKIEPLIHGGGQERHYRAGTENLPGIVGFAKAAEIVKNEMENEAERLSKLRDRLIEETLSKIKYSFLNGHPEKRLPNNANIRFLFVEGESLILNLDFENIEVATGSACTSRALEPSHVLTAIGVPPEEAHGSLQITMGRWTTKENIDRLLAVLPEIVARLRLMSPLTPEDLREELL
ncbi:MAG: cysteine desulfurase family protein [Candidatus Hodarchaeota archaeon]